MNEPFEKPIPSNELRCQIHGLEAGSQRKNYFPMLQRQLDDLQRLRLLMDHSPDALFWAQLPAGNCFDLNRKAREYLNIHSEEEPVVALPDLIQPAAWSTILSMSQKYDPKNLTQETIETEFKTAAGLVLPVEITLGFQREGDQMNVMVVARDLSMRRQAEQMMDIILSGTNAMTGEDFFRSLVRHLATTLNVRYAFVGRLINPSKAGTLAFWSNRGFAQNFEYELKATPCENVYHSGMCLYFDQVQMKFADDQWLKEMNVQAYLGTPLFDASGNIHGMLVLMHDYPIDASSTMQHLLAVFAARAGAELGRQIAEEQKEHLEQQLRHSQKMDAIGQLAGGVAHDFNNLLQVIQGYSSISQAELGPEHPVRQNLNEVLAAAERATTLIRQLLTFSRRERPNKCPVDLNDLIQGLTRMLSRVIGAHIELIVHAHPKLALLLADPGQLEQVLMNLCVNSRDAMTTGGRITITTHNVYLGREFCERHADAHEGLAVMLQVTDNGGGMTADVKERIFEPFFTTKESDKGTGLGLAMVYGIVKQHKGLIDVESSPGRGSTFKIFLPAVDVDDREQTPQLTQKIVPGGTETILLAEDNRPVRDLTAMVLKNAGYQVYAAADGQEAMELFTQHADEIDLVFLDLVMPCMSGVEAGQIINKRKPDLPLLFCSGYSDRYPPEAMMNCEHVGFINKPYERATLLQKVHSLIAMRQPIA